MLHNLMIVHLCLACSLLRCAVSRELHALMSLMLYEAFKQCWCDVQLEVMGVSGTKMNVASLLRCLLLLLLAIAWVRRLALVLQQVLRQPLNRIGRPLLH